MGDPHRIQQALLNFAGNAIKFTDNGSITLRVNKQEKCEESILLRFEIEDTGIVISPEALGRLFGAFEQGDTSTTRQYGGTFWFTARLKKGAMEIKTPDQMIYDDPKNVIKTQYSGAKVLLVEDNLINQDLNEAGLLVEIANNGEEAVEMVSRNNLSSYFDGHGHAKNGWADGHPRNSKNPRPRGYFNPGNDCKRV